MRIRVDQDEAVRAEDHYADDSKLAARQRLWRTSRRDPPFELIPWVLDRVGLTSGSAAAVLDLGCGNGAFLAELERRGQRGRRVAGDLSYGMVAGLEVPAERVQLDAQALPFDCDAFDVVVAAHMLYHVPDRGRLARECRRVLRPGGRLVATTNGPTNIIEVVTMIESAVGGGWQMVMPHHGFGMHNGAEQLADTFDLVVRHDAPVNQTVVTDADALAAYVASMDDFYQPQIDRPWARVVDEVRRTAVDAIERDGELRLTNAVGAFVCT
jgi:SAM-dependent methyltransferase